MAHFAKLNTPLKAAPRYPTTTAQEERFRTQGWSVVSARNLWGLWNASDFISPQERISLDAVEPFDEWEEFALFGCHYFLLVASTTRSTPGWELCKSVSSLSDTDLSSQDAVPSVELEVAYSENPERQGCRRFGAVLPLRSSVRTQERVGVFGGMGLSTRMNTYDVYATDTVGGRHSYHRARSVVPSSRMCHTITDLGEAGALLVGGRTSPDHALGDCWLYHKWLDAWERVDDLPYPQYRHGAVNLGHGHVLVTPGRTESRNISKNFCIWSRTQGWVICVQDPSERPLPAYGSTFLVIEEPIHASASRHGLLAGGISEDGVLLENVWEWNLFEMSSQVKHGHIIFI